MPCNSKRVAAGLGVATVVAIGLLYAYPGHGERHGAEHFTTPFFRKLAAARADRKAKVIAYFSAATRVAEHIADDRLMVDAFVALHGQAEPPDPRQDLALDVHYVSEYGEFYDILLVDRSGRVFHTMRRESDYRANLFEGPLASTKLARSLPDAGQVTFVDYEPYPPSDEPAAFFIVPVHGSATAANEPAGWFVLQCPLNKLNSIVADRRGLGRTGEVYLVNTEQRMVTESRFHRDPADLRLRVDTEAVTTALEFGAGEQVIRDYRGERVLSSFERFEVLGTKWESLSLRLTRRRRSPSTTKNIRGSICAGLPRPSGPYRYNPASGPTTKRPPNVSTQTNMQEPRTGRLSKRVASPRAPRLLRCCPAVSVTWPMSAPQTRFMGNPTSATTIASATCSVGCSDTMCIRTSFRN